MKNVILGMWAFLLTLVLPLPALAAGLNGTAVCRHTFMHCHLPFGGAAFLARQLRQGSSVLGAGNCCAAVCNLRRRCCGRQCGARAYR